MSFRETFTVALVGADGAGKTTVAQMVAHTSNLPVEYVYMGMNPQANPFALPTSRLSYRLKLRSLRASRGSPSVSDPEDKPDLGHVPQDRGRLFAAARLVNRIIEEWVRQLVVWHKRWRGSIVICDRHFVLDFSVRRLNPSTSKPRLSDRIHKWLLAHTYPPPDLVIFLDAPAELLFDRKSDAPMEYLKSRQSYFSRLGEVWPNFARVDAANSPEEVAADVIRILEQHHDERVGKSRRVTG